jgi:hypothetical protein
MKMIKEERPWGWFETIEEKENYKLKKIYVNQINSSLYNIIIIEKNIG